MLRRVVAMLHGSGTQAQCLCKILVGCRTGTLTPAAALVLMRVLVRGCHFQISDLGEGFPNAMHVVERCKHWFHAIENFGCSLTTTRLPWFLMLCTAAKETPVP